jgi:hypothetical protein
MTKKLFVPDHVARAMANKGATSELPRSLENAFGIKPPEESKNEQNPSEFDGSVIERLPQPTGYRILIIPYYPSEKTKGGLFIPDATRNAKALLLFALMLSALGQTHIKIPTSSLVDLGVPRKLGFLSDDMLEIALKSMDLRFAS